MTTSPPTKAVLSTNNIWEDTCDERVKQALRLDTLPDAATGVLEADVVVIGAGVSGLSAAATAASLGAKVILLERAPHAASGASGRNAGIVCMGANLLRCELGEDASHDWLWRETTELALETYAASEQADSVLNMRRCGSLSLAMRPEDGECFKDEVVFRRKMGLEAEVVSATDAAKMCGGRLNVEGVSSVLWLRDEGRCQPWTLCAHLAQKARSAGATMYGGAEVVRMVEGDRWEIELKNGALVHGKALLQCTGPTVEANKRIYAMAFETNLPEDFPVFQDAAPFTYFDYRTGNGHIVCTGGPYGTAGDTAADATYLETMANTVRRWVPELASAQPKYTWAVDLRVTPDMMPQLIELNLDGAPGLAIVGLGALGVLPGILLGRKGAQRLVSTISD